MCVRRQAPPLPLVLASLLGAGADINATNKDYELSYPSRSYPPEKADGDTEDAWALKDASDATVLKFRFVLA